MLIDIDIDRINIDIDIDIDTEIYKSLGQGYWIKTIFF